MNNRMPVTETGKPDVGPPITVRYKNWRGEVATRTISPVHLWFGTTDWHPHTPQWLLHCYDWGKQDWRDYALWDCNFSVSEQARNENAPTTKPTKL